MHLLTHPRWLAVCCFVCSECREAAGMCQSDSPLSLWRDKAAESSCKHGERETCQFFFFLVEASSSLQLAFAFLLLWILSLCQVWPPLMLLNTHLHLNQLTLPRRTFCLMEMESTLKSSLLSVKLAAWLNAKMGCLLTGRSQIQSYSC